MICQKCGSNNLDTAKFCRICGTALSAPGQGVVVTPAKKVGKKFPIKAIAVALAVVIIITAVVGVALGTGIKKMFLNDFEYYLTVEAQNAKDFLGEDFLKLAEKYTSASAKSTLTGSMGGPVLSYDANSDMKLLSEVLNLSKVDIETDYNGKDVVNVAANYVFDSDSKLLDVAATFMNGEIILSSDTITSDVYSLTQDFDNKYTFAEIKDALVNLFISVYKEFDKFKDYTETSDTKVDGKKATKFVLELDYRTVADIVEYAFDYCLEDEVIYYYIETVSEIVLMLDGDSLEEELDGEGYNSLKDFLNHEFKEEILEEFEYEKIEIAYEAIYDNKGVIRGRELTLHSKEYDDTVVFTNDISVKSSDEITSTFEVEGDELIEFTSREGGFSVFMNPEYEVTWELDCNFTADSIDLSFHGEDDNAYCGYDSVTGTTKYDTFILDIDLNTNFSDYDFKPDEGMLDRAKELNEAELEKLYNELMKRTATMID